MTTKPTTEQVRKEFERSYFDPYGGLARFDLDEDGCYLFLEVEFVNFRRGYLAGQREGMERAADLCAQAWPSMQAHWGPGQARAACEDCAAAIRKLKDET